jgi:alkylation response protein AidB-like acyl-CoA dehydrogenase
MNLKFSAEEQAFRDEVRAFLRQNLPADLRERMRLCVAPTKAQAVGWQRTLADRGWAAPHWPKEWGGAGWDVTRRYMFTDELQQFPAPAPNSFVINMLGPVLIAFGTDAQKRRFLPRMIRLDDWWCQGFSEPGSGSDLASLKTSARREGDHYIVNGGKIWTSYAHFADWIFALVRTNPDVKNQLGISFLLIDMKSPGVSVRPIPLIGGDHMVNQVFFDDVKVPAENIVGGEGRGWDCAKFLLGNERIGAAQTGVIKNRIRHAREVAGEVASRGRPLLEDRRFRDRLTALEVDAKALEITTLRLLAQEARKTAPKADPFTSILKLKAADACQAASELALEAAGPRAQSFSRDMFQPGNNDAGGDPLWAPLAASDYFFQRIISIAGGSNEIQRNILAKGMLGL